MPQENQKQVNLIDLQQENQQLLLLQQIALIAAENHDRPTLLKAALEEIQRFFSVNGGGVYQLDHIDSPRYLIANLGIPAELVRELQKIPVGKGLTEQVLRSGSAFNWIDLRCEPLLYCHAVLDAGWRSLLSLPLVTDDRTIGILFLFQRISRQFSQQEINLLTRICRILASAIATTELLEKLEWQQQMTQAGQRELERSRTQLRAHLFRLEESNRSLEQTNQAKNRFLSVASHELRTPLTSVICATELLQMKLPEAPGEICELLNMLKQGGLRLQSLVEDLLEMVRIESRDLYLAKEPLDIIQILKDLHLEFKVKANDQEISLTHADLPEKLSPLGDDYHLRRALGRLLDNALKFTPQNGQIHLQTKRCNGQELWGKRLYLEKFCPDFFNSTLSDDYLQLMISDSGAGIDKEEQVRIFDKFHGATPLKNHGQSANTSNSSGAGLGLPLAKGIIEGHGGMLWVDCPSEQNRGSTFNVLLPLVHCPPVSGNGE